MREKPKFMIFEKRETLWQSIASDLVSFGLALLLMFFSAFMNQAIWVGVSVVLFAFCFIGLSSKSKWEKLKSKQEAINWANNLDEDG